MIVAAEITQQANDSRQLLLMLEQVESNMGRKPAAGGAGAGYWSEANDSDEIVAGIDLLIATGRIKHGEDIATESGPTPQPRPGN